MSAPDEHPASAPNQEGLDRLDQGKPAEAEPLFRQALQLLEEADPADAERGLDRAAARLNLGLAVESLGRRAEAIDHYRQAIGTLEDLASRQVAASLPDLAHALSSLAGALDLDGQVDAAIAAQREAISIHEQLGQIGDDEHALLGASTRLGLGGVLAERGDGPGAVAEFRAAADVLLDRHLAGHPGAHPELTLAWSHLVAGLEAIGRASEAVEFFQAAADRLEGDGRDLFRTDAQAARGHMAHALDTAGRSDEAIAAYRAAIRALDAQPDRDDHADATLAAARYHLGGVLDRNRRWDDAVREYRKAVAGFESLVGRGVEERRPELANAHTNLGSVLGSQGRLSAALVHFERAVELDSKLVAEAWPGREYDLIDARINLGVAYAADGRREEAADQYVAVAQAYDELADSDRLADRALDRAHARARLGLMFEELGRDQEAVAELERALTLYEPLAAADPEQSAEAVDLAVARLHLGKVLGKRGDWPHADQELTKAEQTLSRREAQGDATVTLDLAAARLARGHAAKARAELDRAVALYEQATIGYQAIVDTGRADLAGLLDRAGGHLGLALVASGRVGAAIEWYRRLLERPPSPESEADRARLKRQLDEALAHRAAP